MDLGLAVRKVACNLQIEAQRRQLMPDQVVQLTRDAESFAQATAFGEERLRRV